MADIEPCSQGNLMLDFLTPSLYDSANSIPSMAPTISPQKKARGKKYHPISDLQAVRTLSHPPTLEMK
jgi:hypothetical protein